MDKLLLRVEEVAELLGVGRTRVYQLIREGELASIKIDGSRRVPTTAVEQYLVRLLDVA
jgi:excisionase family DNA binding protein